MKAKNLDIQRHSGALDITYTWRTPIAWFLLFFCIVWDGFITIFLLSGAGWFISIHLLVGVFLTWYMICLFVNKTKIRVDSREVDIKHGPLPSLSRNRTIPSRSIRQIFLKKGARQQSGNKVTILWNVMAELDTGVEVSIVTRLGDKSMAKELERSIENFLGIRDEPRDEEVFTLPDLTAIKEKLPAGLRGKLENVERRVREEYTRYEEGGAEAGELGPLLKDLGMEMRGKARKLPPPHDTYNFNLYQAPQGAEFILLDQPYTVGRSAQIDFEDTRIPIARQIETRPVQTGESRNFYTELARERWSYYEERRLDDDELASLGFVGEQHPPSFSNGNEKYYPRNQQLGTRYFGDSSQEVEQYIYFTTRSLAQFRALRPLSGGWEVYVQEPFDAAHFEVAD